MRPSHFTITPAVVHQRARLAMEPTLPWEAFGQSVAAVDVLDLLLLMAVSGASLFAIVTRFFAFSHETARQAVKANLPDVQCMVQGLLQALYDTAQFSRPDRRRHWRVAIDTH